MYKTLNLPLGLCFISRREIIPSVARKNQRARSTFALHRVTQGTSTVETCDCRKVMSGYCIFFTVQEVDGHLTSTRKRSIIRVERNAV